MDFETSVVTSKGQLVIPARLRRRLGIRQGTQVSLTEEGGRIILQPLTQEYIQSLRGSLKGKCSALDYLLEERQRERTP
jgi:AbrB family looped-hinge helix DNA binding protein